MPVMENADRLTGRTIQAVMRQSVSSPYPKHEGLLDQGYCDGRRDAIRKSHAVQGKSRRVVREPQDSSFNYIQQPSDGTLLRKRDAWLNFIVRIVPDSGSDKSVYRHVLDANRCRHSENMYRKSTQTVNRAQKR